MPWRSAVGASLRAIGRQPCRNWNGAGLTCELGRAGHRIAMLALVCHAASVKSHSARPQTRGALCSGRITQSTGFDAGDLVCSADRPKPFAIPSSRFGGSRHDLTSRAMARRSEQRPNSGVRRALRWGEQDSNHRSRVTRPIFQCRLWLVTRQPKSRSEREPTHEASDPSPAEPMVRILFAPSASQ